MSLGLLSRTPVVLRPQVDPHPESVTSIDAHSDVDLIYVMRDDTAYCADWFAARLSALEIERAQIRSVLRDAYGLFQSELQSALFDAFAQHTQVQIHLLDPDVLREGVRARAKQHQVVSLDPLYTHDCFSLQSSRCYLLGGRYIEGLVSRPGSASMRSQLAALRFITQSKPCVLVDDDIYSGTTITRSIHLLHKAGIDVERVITGTRIASKSLHATIQAPVESVVTYSGTCIDLGDPRNFLMGVGGLVVRLPDGGLGRAPYHLPYVDTAARASIDEVQQRKLALRVLEANAEFFLALQRSLDLPIYVRDLDLSFARLVDSLHGVRPETPVADLIEFIYCNIDRLTSYVAGLERVQLFSFRDSENAR